jgi:hypothetical protein
MYGKKIVPVILFISSSTHEDMKARLHTVARKYVLDKKL